jgi:hypothetical protein
VAALMIELAVFWVAAIVILVGACRLYLWWVEA